eukprot:scaffold152615_cov21-Tisochrysis_lutea.AAC.1
MEWGCKRMQATDDPAEPDNGNQLTLIWHKHTHTLSLCGFAMRTEVVDVIRTANREGKLNTWVSIQYATPEVRPYSMLHLTEGTGKAGKAIKTTASHVLSLHYTSVHAAIPTMRLALQMEGSS